MYRTSTEALIFKLSEIKRKWIWIYENCLIINIILIIYQRWLRAFSWFKPGPCSCAHSEDDTENTLLLCSVFSLPMQLLEFLLELEFMNNLKKKNTEISISTNQAFFSHTIMIKFLHYLIANWNIGYGRVACVLMTTFLQSHVHVQVSISCNSILIFFSVSFNSSSLRVSAVIHISYAATAVQFKSFGHYSILDYCLLLSIEYIFPCNIFSLYIPVSFASSCRPRIFPAARSTDNA